MNNKSYAIESGLEEYKWRRSFPFTLRRSCHLFTINQKESKIDFVYAMKDFYFNVMSQSTYFLYLTPVTILLSTLRQILMCLYKVNGESIKALELKLKWNWHDETGLCNKLQKSKILVNCRFVLLITCSI